VLLAVMGVACFASMWIRCADSRAPTVSINLYLNLILSHSNVAAPTLCFTLVRVRPHYARIRPASLTFSPTLSQPILRTLPPKAPFGPCLVVSPSLYCLVLKPDPPCLVARDRSGSQHWRAGVPYLVAPELDCFRSDATTT
jgi:hypothetical protein